MQQYVSDFWWPEWDCVIDTSWDANPKSPELQKDPNAKEV